MRVQPTGDRRGIGCLARAAAVFAGVLVLVVVLGLTVWDEPLLALLAPLAIGVGVVSAILGHLARRR